jgi:hypothetical protein
MKIAPATYEIFRVTFSDIFWIFILKDEDAIFCAKIWTYSDREFMTSFFTALSFVFILIKQIYDVKLELMIGKRSFDRVHGC